MPFQVSRRLNANEPSQVNHPKPIKLYTMVTAPVIGPIKTLAPSSCGSTLILEGNTYVVGARDRVNNK